jgi:hypothetical protein
MQLSETQTKVAVVFIVLLVIGVGYFLWTRSVPPEPVPGPGQTIQNPLGEPRPSTASGTGGMGTNQMPVPGRVDPRRGFGPSGNAPIPGNPNAVRVPSNR